MHFFISYICIYTGPPSRVYYTVPESSIYWSWRVCEEEEEARCMGDSCSHKSWDIL